MIFLLFQKRENRVAYLQTDEHYNPSGEEKRYNNNKNEKPLL